MKIFFDAHIFSQQKVGGISRLNFELAKALGRKKDVEQIFYRGLYVDNYPFKREWFKKQYGFKRPFLSSFFNVIDSWAMEFLYRLHSDKVIFYCAYYRIPKKLHGPLAVMVYDMIEELFVKNPKVVQFKKRAIFSADMIIAISNSCKQDILKLYPQISPEKIVVAYPGVSEIFFKNQPAPQDTKRPYMLYMGPRRYVYKNFDLLLDTFIDKKYFLDFDLVLVGGEKELTLAQKEKVKHTANEGTWLRQEFGDDQKLATLYAGAKVFIYPSLYEGFGIPPLEAMASGCPVIASNASSIPEAVGDAGLLFDPNNSNDLAEKIEKIIHDEKLVSELVEKGRARAKQFTWDAMADKVYSAYKQLEK